LVEDATNVGTLIVKKELKLTFIYILGHLRNGIKKKSLKILLETGVK